MLSDHAVKTGQVPYKALLLAGAGLTFIGLLAAMVTVLQGQSQRVELRTAQNNSEQHAIAGCMASQFGIALDSCVRDARLAAHLVRTGEAGGATVVAASPANRFEMTLMPSGLAVPGVMPAFLATR